MHSCGVYRSEKTTEKEIAEVDETMQKECLIKKQSQQKRSGERM